MARHSGSFCIIARLCDGSGSFFKFAAALARKMALKFPGTLKK
jgi:hypothetical protein